MHFSGIRVPAECLFQAFAALSEVNRALFGGDDFDLLFCGLWGWVIGRALGGIDWLERRGRTRWLVIACR